MSISSPRCEGTSTCHGEVRRRMVRHFFLFRTRFPQAGRAAAQCILVLKALYLRRGVERNGINQRDVVRMDERDKGRGPGTRPSHGLAAWPGWTRPWALELPIEGPSRAGRSSGALADSICSVSGLYFRGSVRVLIAPLTTAFSFIPTSTCLQPSPILACL